MFGWEWSSNENIEVANVVLAGGDIGTGDSRFTWKTKVGLGYQFNKFTGTFGFRYEKWNFGSSNELDNLTVIGPYVGARWNW